MRTAIYAGSFDPPTVGHEYIIREGAKLFDKLVVVIATNPAKQSYVPVDIRKDCLEDMLRDLSNVNIIIVENLMTVDIAKSENATYLLRGLRTNTDFDYEYSLTHFNHTLDTQLQSVFIMYPKELTEISSSTIKGLIGFKGWLSAIINLVPKSVLQFLVMQYGLTNSNECIWDKKIYTELVQILTSSDRYYHNLIHVEWCLQQFPFSLFDKSWLDISRAIWLHDIKPTVAESIEYTKTMQLPNEDFIIRLIRSTEHPINSFDSEIEMCMHDTDLSILAAPKHVYSWYTKNVYQEYAQYERKTFVQARILFIQKLLQNPIFVHHYFRPLEEKARYNLLTELGQLNAEYLVDHPGYKKL